jgi:hypothetical protein
LSLAGVSIGCFAATAYAEEEGKLFRFTDPTPTENQLIISGASKVIPTPVQIANVTFDNGILAEHLNGGNAEITYTMPEPGFVTIRVLRRGTRELYLATIVNFEFRDTGAHTEVWDGRDYYGERLDAFSTPFDYRIMAESVAAGSPPPDYKNVDYAEGESQQDVVDKTNFTRHIHNWHEEKFERIPLLTISAPQSGNSLRGKVLIKSAIDRERRSFGDKYGYGVRYYVDGEIVHEEFYTPESGGRFSYELDTTGFRDGKHVLYVGLCDHNDHVTSHGVEVLFRNFSE